ncbi:MAG TPA: class I SAM-dependent methyltransferase [Anaerolineaceae bacterium]|nr:class I SAM-dependent methyltransferase [Anaerolineaceae bacterium]
MERNVKQEVRQFYDRVGWQKVGEGVYQNSRYEDLRPVASEYIHLCHLRINEHLHQGGRLLLDAGSGPIQYTEYLTYSETYQKRVCLDISIVALKEARQRIGAEHGLFVVGDVANLPFRSGIFDGIVSLHTLHHLPQEDQVKAYEDLYRVLAFNRSMVIVNGWTDSPLMNRTGWLVRMADRVRWRLEKSDREILVEKKPAETLLDDTPLLPKGTFIQKQNAAWLRTKLTGKMEFEIRVWRSVNMQFLRALIHPKLAGKFWLRLLFWLEERFPHYFGEQGQYPLIVISK